MMRYTGSSLRSLEMHALQGSLLRLEQMIRFDLTSPLDVVQTLSEFSGLKAVHKLFGWQTILRLESPQAPGSAIQAQLEHLQFRADSGLQKRFEIDGDIADFYAWCLTTAALIREGKWYDIDPESVAEEVESLGRSQKRELASRLEVLMMHLLKWCYQPERRESSHSWYDTIVEQRSQLTRLLRDNPSLCPQVSTLLTEEYPDARRRAIGETQIFKDNELLITDWAPIHLANVLKTWFWKPDVQDVSALEVWQKTCQYHTTARR